MAFLPIKVIHDVKYSRWKPQFVGKIERNKNLVFTKLCLAKFFLIGNLQKFIHVQLKKFANFWPRKTFYSITAQISKLTNLNSIVIENFPCPSRMSKFLQVYLIIHVIDDRLVMFCNWWTLLTFSQKSVSGMIMYRLANNLNYLIGCWISHGFTLKKCSYMICFH